MPAKLAKKIFGKVDPKPKKTFGQTGCHCKPGSKRHSLAEIAQHASDHS